jgi:hypothetical protein
MGVFYEKRKEKGEKRKKGRMARAKDKRGYFE